jgi:hypothetical protein
MERSSSSSNPSLDSVRLCSLRAVKSVGHAEVASRMQRNAAGPAATQGLQHVFLYARENERAAGVCKSLFTFDQGVERRTVQVVAIL